MTALTNGRVSGNCQPTYIPRTRCLIAVDCTSMGEMPYKLIISLPLHRTRGSSGERAVLARRLQGVTIIIITAL